MRRLRLCTKWRAQRSRLHVRRPSGKFCDPRHVADHWEVIEPERERKRHVHLGRSDANADQGRDKMPESGQGVRPLNKQNKSDKM